MSAPARFKMPLSTQNRDKHLWECRKGEKNTRYGIAFEHQGYGMIEPHSFHGHYRRAFCPCEQAVFEQYKHEEERREQERQRQRRIKTALGWIGDHRAPLELTKKTFDNFDAKLQPEAYDTVRDFMQILQGALMLYGGFGTGKTHLLSAMTNALVALGHDCKFTNLNNFFAAIQDAISHDQPHQSIIDAAINTRLLILDDVDKSKPSKFRLDVLYEIIDARTQRGLPLAMSTNRFSELADFIGEASASRMQMGLLAVEMVGEDYRSKL